MCNCNKNNNLVKISPICCYYGKQSVCDYMVDIKDLESGNTTCKYMNKRNFECQNKVAITDRLLSELADNYSQLAEILIDKEEGLK